MNCFTFSSSNIHKKTQFHLALTWPTWQLLNIFFHRCDENCRYCQCNLAPAYHLHALHFATNGWIRCCNYLWRAVFCDPNCQSHQNAVRHSPSQQSAGWCCDCTSNVSGNAAREEDCRQYVCCSHYPFCFPDASLFNEVFWTSISSSALYCITLVSNRSISDVVY